MAAGNGSGVSSGRATLGTSLLRLGAHHILLQGGPSSQLDPDISRPLGFPNRARQGVLYVFAPAPLLGFTYHTR